LPLDKLTAGCYIIFEMKTKGGEKMKGMLVDILKGQYKSTNNGVSSFNTDALLVGDEVAAIFDEDPNRPTLKLVRRNISGKEYLHAEPIGSPTPGRVGWMAGGNYLYSSDSRFPNAYPIAIHDRQESAEHYETLSR